MVETEGIEAWSMRRFVDELDELDDELDIFT